MNREIPDFLRFSLCFLTMSLAVCSLILPYGFALAVRLAQLQCLLAGTRLLGTQPSILTFLFLCLRFFFCLEVYTKASWENIVCVIVSEAFMFLTNSDFRTLWSFKRKNVFIVLVLAMAAFETLAGLRGLSHKSVNHRITMAVILLVNAGTHLGQAANLYST